MKIIFALFLAAILAGCATVETSDVGGRHMVVVSNSGWYLFNLIPIASGNPEKVNKVSCSLFSETATLENNYKILNDFVKASGAESVKTLKSFWSDESILVVLMKRHVIHTTAEIVFDKDGEKK
jgi:hypothetical protein